MAGYTGDIGQAAVPKQRARQLWKHTTVRRHIHPVLKSALAEMAPGLERCMYCGDNQGTDIDHFEPLHVNPLRTFDWNNHLLACSLCNSHLKRDLFPLARDGTPLLIDPSAEDPAPHLHLSLAAGEYLDLTDRGTATIKVFGLNRKILVRGRLNAYRITPLLLNEWRTAFEKDDLEEAAACAATIWEQPTADVVHAMFHFVANLRAIRRFLRDQGIQPRKAGTQSAAPQPGEPTDPPQARPLPTEQVEPPPRE